MSSWNRNRFSIFTSDELDALGLIEELGKHTNTNSDEIERLTISDNKKVSHEEMQEVYKIDKEANFTGSWFGIKRPSQSNEGMAGTLDQLTEVEIPNLKNGKQNKSSVSLDDVNFDVDIQSIINSNLGISKLTLSKERIYNLSDTLYVPSNFELNLNGSTLSLKGVDKPVIAKQGEIRGKTIIRNGIIEGDITQPNNKGIELNDFYSHIYDMEIKNTGNQGIHCINGGASSTLVENIFKNIIFRNCQGIAFETDGGNKITDGVIENFIIHGANKNKALYVGSGAGWIIDKVHIYGFEAVGGPFDVRNAYNTNISNIYIEGSGGNCLQITSVQQSLNLNNITIVVSTNTTACVFTSKSSATDYDAYVNISNLNVVNNLEKSVNAIDSDGTNVYVSLANYSKQGYFKDKVQIGTKVKSKTKVIENARISGELIGESGILSLDGNKFSSYFTKNWNGSGEKSIVIPLQRLNAFDKIPFNVSIFSQKWDTQGGQVKYSASGLISTGASISSNAISTLENGTNVGFTTPPTFTINPSDKTLIITFTPLKTDNSDQGVLYINFGY